jgi:hypothetical protein
MPARVPVGKSYSDAAFVTLVALGLVPAVGGQKGWAVQEPVSQPNIFPGFTLLMIILHSPPAASDRRPPSGVGSDRACGW